MHSSIYYELRSHNRYEVWGRKLLIAAVTFAICLPIACLVYNAFYNVEATHANHEIMANEALIAFHNQFVANHPLTITN
jgi:hypothetical protein